MAITIFRKQERFTVWFMAFSGEVLDTITRKVIWKKNQLSWRGNLHVPTSQLKLDLWRISLWDNDFWILLYIYYLSNLWLVIVVSRYIIWHSFTRICWKFSKHCRCIFQLTNLNFAYNMTLERLNKLLLQEYAFSYT